MFQFARLSLACPWIQQQFERLTYSGISGSMLIFNSPKHFVAYYALPRLWVPRYPPVCLDLVPLSRPAPKQCFTPRCPVNCCASTHFGENQLALGSSGISPLTTTHPLILQHQSVWTST
ncbi:hypothetical protein HanIR_Chr06g0289341 [Helianthus annuus]|nr:hypothetical protein HanIR_Chr06g0289341 [Helianthus annuus]